MTKSFFQKNRIIDALFFAGIYLASLRTLRDFDIWFHLKTGEIFAQKGIINYDVFSFTAVGRELHPYEWLFQITVYYVSQIFGLNAIPPFIALIVTILIGALYILLRHIIGLKKIISYTLCLFFLASTFEFFTARPHVLAYTFLTINFLLILFYFQKNKNLLWATIPITLMWTNMHGSIFLDIFFFASYTILSLFNFYLLKEKIWLRKAKMLGFYTVITSVLTILPPLGITQYKLLVVFYQKKEIITKFIDEWTPLINNAFPFFLYSITIVIVFGLLGFSLYKKKNYKDIIWLLPIMPLPFAAYISVRNVFFGYFVFLIITGFSLKNLEDVKFGKKIKRLSQLILISLVMFHIWMLYSKHQPDRLYYPVKAVNFIKTFDVKGNMFNEYGYGGYLLYELYPERKVFIDGRTDIYLCCEMPETLDIAFQKRAPDPEFKKLLDKMWDKHDISYAFFRTEKHSVLRRIARILNDDPDWNLVFWDDDTILYVRRDGKNDHILNKLETKAATPYNQNPYRDGLEKDAFIEYQRMIKVADSSKSRNALGYIYLRQQKYEEAAAEFEKAIAIDPTNESPYMNLAELTAKDGNFEQSIALYKKALSWAPDRGLIYIRLGQLTLQSTGNLEAAKGIWAEGAKKTIDTDAKKKLEQLLQN